MNILDLFLKAELSLASYAELPNGQPIPSNLEQGGKGLSTAQAVEFSSNYTVVTQYNDTPIEDGLGTSFSATVFKDTDGNLTLAIRGTLELGDIVPTDANIATEGAGYDQIVAMYNWWQRVSNPIGQSVPQYTIEFGSVINGQAPITNATETTSENYLTFKQTIFGDTNDNVFNGGSGNDTINGLNGSDTIEGNQGYEFLFAHYQAA